MKILIAEDDLVPRTLLTEILRGHDIMATVNGAEAWEAMQQPDAPKLAILDWMMPEKDGIEVCRLIRTLETDQPPYIIMLTGKGEKTDIIAGLEAGADDYLAKPYDFGELRARVAVGIRVIETQAKQREAEAALIQSEKMASLGRLSAGVAHELKNPLGIIIQGIAYVRSSVENPEIVDVCERITKSAIRANAIIQNLLNFARQTPLSLEETALCALVEEAIEMVEHQMNLKNIQIIRNFPSDLCTVKVDGNQMKQVFINILVNALDAMQGGGEITITITPGASRDGAPCVEITIADTGTGIPREVLRKVFDPFFTMKEPGKGTGLGLSVTKGIIERHDGRITIDSAVGEGATVKIAIPCNSSQEEGVPHESTKDSSHR
jgi:two-component system, NtrC family, sensor kinase